MKKTILIASALFLVIGGSAAYLFADQTTPAPTSVPTVTGTEAEVTVEADTDNVEVQEGDQNSPDNGTSEKD